MAHVFLAESTTNEGELNSAAYWTSVTRVANYPVITNLVETAKGYYSAAKEVSPTAQVYPAALDLH